jgi:hypothetical protein
MSIHAPSSSQVTDPIRTSTIVTSTVPGASSTFNFPIYTGESLRVGAFSTALTETTDISSTLNSMWIRNVNNFLNLNITPAVNDPFLDAPRNMARSRHTQHRLRPVQTPIFVEKHR